MSKRELRKYIKSLKRSHLEDQVLELYSKFKPVKVYYDFVFNPKEDKLLEEARTKIYKEYFPTSRGVRKRKPKKRRSVAQKLIKQYITLGVKSEVVMEVMLFNIETAILYNQDNRHKQDSFYKSMLTSFEQLIEYGEVHGMQTSVKNRISIILTQIEQQNWINETAFFRVSESTCNVQD